MMMHDRQVVQAVTPIWVHAHVIRPPKHKPGPTSWAHKAYTRSVILSPHTTECRSRQDSSGSWVANHPPHLWGRNTSPKTVGTKKENILYPRESQSTTISHSRIRTGMSFQYMSRDTVVPGWPVVVRPPIAADVRARCMAAKRDGQGHSS